MQQCGERREGQWRGAVVAFRATRGQKLRQRCCGRRRRQRDAVPRRPRGGQLQPRIVGGPLAGRPRIGRQPVEAPICGGPALCRPARRRRPGRLGEPGPAQGAFQRGCGLRAPRGKERAKPGARRHLRAHRRAGGAEHSTTGRPPARLERRIGREPPGPTWRRRRAPAGAGPRREQPRHLAWAKLDMQLRLPAAQERQRETARPECGRQDGQVVIDRDRHAGPERVERPRRADGRAPGDVPQGADEAQMALGRIALRRHVRQQPQQQHGARFPCPLARMRHGFLCRQRRRMSFGTRRMRQPFTKFRR
jgi:hypothetical protein